MISESINRCQSYIYQQSERLVNQKNWKWKLSMILVLVVYFFAFPSYELISKEYSFHWSAISAQINHPFTDTHYEATSHQSKLTFRLTVPLIARVLHLGIVGLLILQGILGFFTFYFSLNILDRLLKDKIVVVLLGFSLAFIYAGKSGFIDLMACFDGVAIFFLVSSIHFKSPVIIFLSVFLASFTDERALIASSLVFLFWVYLSLIERKRRLSIQSLTIIFSWLAYFIVRYILTIKFGLSTYVGDVGTRVFLDQVNNFQIGIWTALEGIWILVFFSFITLWKRKQFFYGFMFLGAIAIVLIAALAVKDITRSMAYLLPAFFIVLLILKDEDTPSVFRKLALITTFFCFIYPPYSIGEVSFISLAYSMPLQILRYLANGS
jgi:hypothetical protein